MLPKREEAKNAANAVKFANSSVAILIGAMKRRGTKVAHITAKIFGGANMFPAIQGNQLGNIGFRNVLAVKEVLEKEKIRIVAEDWGGYSGRTILFDIKDGTVYVKDAKGKERIY